MEKVVNEQTGDVDKCLKELSLSKYYKEFAPIILKKQVKVMAYIRRIRNVAKEPLSLFSQSSKTFCNWAKDNFGIFEEIVTKRPLKKNLLKKIVSFSDSPAFIHKCYTSPLPQLDCLVGDVEYLNFMQDYDEKFYRHVWGSSMLVDKEPPVFTLYSASEKEEIMLLLVFKRAEQKIFHSKSTMKKIPINIKKKIFDHLLQLNCSFGPLSEYEKNVPFHQLLTPTDHSRLTSGPAIVSPQEFLFNFDSFTQGLFRNFDWSNAVVQGGAIVFSLLGSPRKLRTGESLSEVYFSEFPSSDIDVYLYGLTVTDFWKKVAYIHQHLSQGGKRPLLLLYTSSTIIFVPEYPYRRVQIIIGEWERKEYIITNTDIDPTGVCFDGNNVFSTYRAFLAFTKRWVVTSQFAFGIRGTPQYEKRLCKYSARGFKIVDFEKVKQEKVVHSEEHGAGLLAKLDSEKKEYPIMDHFKQEKTGIPHGPEYSLEKIKSEILENGYLNVSFFLPFFF